MLIIKYAIYSVKKIMETLYIVVFDALFETAVSFGIFVNVVLAIQIL